MPATVVASAAVVMAVGSRILSHAYRSLLGTTRERHSDQRPSSEPRSQFKMSGMMTRAERLLSEASVKEGWLTKRAMISGRNWRRRWFVMTRESISYYNKPGQVCFTTY